MKNSTLWKILRYIKYNIFSIQFKKIYVLELDESVNYTLDEDHSVVFKFSTYDDIKKLTGSEHDYEKDDLAFSKQRIKEGDKVVIGYIDNCPIFYGWQMFGEFELSYLKYQQLNSEIIYSYKVFVVLSQRKKSILRKYYNFISPYYVKKGIKSIIVVIDNKNTGSIIAHQKCDFTAAGNIITIKIGSFTYNCTSSKPFGQLIT